MKHRIVIADLIMEGQNTCSIKQIMMDRHHIHKIVHKYKTEGMYMDRKRVGDRRKFRNSLTELFRVYI